MAIRFAEFIAQFVWGGCMLAILWGAFKIASSRGNEEGRNQGQTIIITAMIGFVLAMASQYLLDFAAGLFSGL